MKSPEMQFAAESAAAFEKGNERFEATKEAAKNFINDTRKKIGGFFSKVGSGMSSFFKKARDGVFGSPELYKATDKYVSTKYDQGYEYVAQKAGAVGDSIVEGAAYVGDKLEEKMSTIGGTLYEGAKSFDTSVNETYDQAYNFSVNKIHEAKKWVMEKRDAAEVIGHLAKSTAASVADFAVEKTKEKFHAATAAVADRYEKVRDFAGGMFFAGLLGIARAKERFSDKINEIRIKHATEKIRANIELLKKLGVNVKYATS